MTSPDRRPLSSSGTTAASAKAKDYLEKVHRSKGLGTWRSLYLELLRSPCLKGFTSIIEVGAGSADFLVSTGVQRCLAVDVSDKYRSAFEAAGVEFVVRDLESEDLSGQGHFDVAVCSDVFEHLLSPQVALRSISEVLEPRGILFSHVPNEYRLMTTLRIMLGLQEGVYFHPGEREWTDPHLRRFTDIGYLRFLQQAFRYNVKITPLRYKGLAKLLRRARLTVPFCLEGGPTYASTNSAETRAKILDAAKGL